MPRVGNYPDASSLVGNERLLADQNGQVVNITPDDLAAYADLFNASENADTYVNWQSKKAAGTLPVGEFIEITNKGDLGIVLYCVSATQLSLAGTGGFLNSDFQAAGVYTGVAGYAGWLGQWHSGLAAVAINKVAIYNTLHYKNLTGAVGTAPSGDAVNWVLLPKTTANVGYIEEWDAIEYDFDADVIKHRKDSRGNFIEDYTQFQWGNDNVIQNYQHSGGTLTCINNRGIMNQNRVTVNSTLDASTNSGGINYNILHSSAVITATSNTGNIDLNVIQSNSYITATTNSGDILANCINAESGIIATSNSGTIEANVLSGGVITATTNAGTILQNTFNAAATITANLNGGVTVRQCLFSYITATMPVAINYTGKTCISGFSNFNCTISITGLTTLNITTANNFCGIVNLTSGNATETLTDITNFPTFQRFIIYPASNITALTLTGDPLPTAAGKIALASASLVLDGSKGDWCEFEVAKLATNYVQQTDAMNYN